MQIFYIVAVVAVFVLCVALLSTARRILRSSPLASGELGIGRLYDVERPEEDSFDVVDSHPTLSNIEAAQEKVDDPSYDRSFEPSFERSVEAGVRVPELPHTYAAQREFRTEVVSPTPIQPVAEISSAAMDFDSFEAAYMFEGEQQSAERKTFQTREKSARFRLPRPSRQTYQYALECLLLGVSAYVLVKTQQSNMKQRSQQVSPQASSKGRVA